MLRTAKAFLVFDKLIEINARHHVESSEALKIVEANNYAVA